MSKKLNELYKQLDKDAKQVNDCYIKAEKYESIKRDERLAMVNITKSLLPSFNKICEENGIEILEAGVRKDVIGDFVSYIICKFINPNISCNKETLQKLFRKYINSKNPYSISIMKESDSVEKILVKISLEKFSMSISP